MSSTTMRYHQLTFAFLPGRKERRIHTFVRSLRLRVSRRQAKRALRSLVNQTLFTT